MKLHILNPNDRNFYKNRYILQFGTYGTIAIMVWASGLESALDECVDYIAEHAPGLLVNSLVESDYNFAIASGKTDSEAYETATADTTCAGNCGDYIAASEWGIWAENPSRREVLVLVSSCREVSF